MRKAALWAETCSRRRLMGWRSMHSFPSSHWHWIFTCPTPCEAGPAETCWDGIFLLQLRLWNGALSNMIVIKLTRVIRAHFVQIPSLFLFLHPNVSPLMGLRSVCCLGVLQVQASSGGAIAYCSSSISTGWPMGKEPSWDRQWSTFSICSAIK